MTPRPEIPQEDQMIGLRDAGRLIGVTDRTIRRYIYEGKLPGYSVAGGRVIRVRRGDVESLLTPVEVDDP